MKILLIVVAVVMLALAVLLSFYIGGMIAISLLLALMSDAIDKEIISDIDVDEEKMESYSPDKTNIEKEYNEIMRMLLKEHILTKVLIRRFKNKK